MDLELTSELGLTVGGVSDMLAVAESAGTAQDARLYAMTDHDGLLVSLRVEDGRHMHEASEVSSSVNKDGSPSASVLHTELGHAGDPADCGEIACLTARGVNRGVTYGREDKTHPAGQDRT